MGGTRATDAAASRDAWNKLVAFFNELSIRKTPLKELALLRKNNENFLVLFQYRE